MKRLLFLFFIVLVSLLAFADAKVGVTCLQFSPGGGVIASGHDDGSVSLWGPGSKLKRTWSPHSDYVHGVDFVSDRQMVSWSRDDTVTMTDLVSRRQQKWPAPANCEVSSGVLSPRRDVLATCGSATTLLWDLKSGRTRRLESPGLGFDSMAFSRSGDRLALGYGDDADGCVVLVDVKSGRRLRKIVTPCDAVGFNAEGNLLVVGGNSLYFYDPETGAQLRKLELGIEAENLALCVSPSGRSVAVMGTQEINYASVIFEGDKRAFSLGSRIVGFAGEDRVVELPGAAGYLKVLSVSSGEVVKKVPVPGTSDDVLGMPSNFAISRDGKSFARTGSSSGMVKTFRL